VLSTVRQVNVVSSGYCWRRTQMFRFRMLLGATYVSGGAILATLPIEYPSRSYNIKRVKVFCRLSSNTISDFEAPLRPSINIQDHTYKTVFQNGA
jgi:hypothetical protein